MTTPGERIRELRIARGLSQEQVGAGHYSASYVSLIESGSRPATARALGVIATTLGSTADYLATGREPGSDRRTELAIRKLTRARDQGELTAVESETASLLQQPLDTAQRTRVLTLRAEALERLGHLAAAIALYDELLTQSRTAEASVSSASCAIALSRCLREAGDLDRAIEVAADELTHDHDDQLTVELTSTLACAYVERGDLATARLLLDHALELATASGSHRARGAALWNLSLVAEQTADIPRALELADRALALFAEDDDERNLARLRNSLACVLLADDPPQTARALQLLTDARAMLETTGSVIDIAYCDTEIARALLLKGQPKKALAAARSSLSALSTDDLQALEAARALIVAAKAYRELDDTEASLQSQQLAIERLETAGASRQATKAWTELAAHQEDIGDLTAALASYKRATGAPARSSLHR